MQTSKWYKPLLIFAYSLLTTYLVITFRFFPFLGLAIALASLATITFYYKKKKTLLSAILFAGIINLSIFLMLRANEILVTLNILGILYLGSILALLDTKKFDFSFFEVMFSPLLIIGESLIQKNTLYDSSELKEGKTKNKDKRNLEEIVIGILASLGILLLIIPLLSSANPIFKSWVHINFSIPDLIKDFFEDGGILKIFFFGFLAFWLPRYFGRVNKYKDNIEPKIITTKSLQLLIPKITTIIVLFVFFASQIKLYLASTEYLESIGYSNSRQTNEVFFQLAIVTGVVLILIYKDKSKEIRNKISTYLLVLQGLFLTAIAINSDLEYVSNWGLTHKRLYGFIIIAWISVMLMVALVDYIKEYRSNELVKFGVVYTMILLITVNILNFDYLIYNYGQSVTHLGTDYIYLAKLSTDSNSYEQQYKVLKQNLEKDLESETIDNSRNIAASKELYRNIIRVSDKYKNENFSYLRDFNYSQYKENKKMSRYNMEEFNTLILGVENKFWEQYNYPEKNQRIEIDQNGTVQQTR